MKHIRKKLVALLLAAASLVGISLASAAPAQAVLNPIVYTADCPVNNLNEVATWQQLVVVDYSGNTHQIAAWENYPTGSAGSQVVDSWTNSNGVYYVPGQDGDVVQYTLSLHDNLNWSYHVDCFY